MRGRAGQRGAPATIARDAHARRADRSRWHAVPRDGALCARRERCKADRGGVRPEDGVDVLEERVSDDPRWPGAAALGRGGHEDGAETLAVRYLGQSEVV